MFTCYEYFGCLSTVLPQVPAAAVDDDGDSDVELVHTLHKGQGQLAPGQYSKVNPVTSVSSHLYPVGARVESAWRDNLREVVLRKGNYCATDYLQLLYRVTVVFIDFLVLKIPEQTIQK